MERQADISKSYNPVVRFSSDTIPQDTGTYTYSDSERRKKNYLASGRANIRIGAGRIEDVTFAVAAMNMLDRIAETEKSYDGCSAQYVQMLADLIAKKRRRRIMDSRIGFIENVDSLCSFIIKKGIAGELSPRTVLELADQWEYAFHQIRHRGYTVLLSPEVYYSRQFEMTESSASICIVGISGPFDFENTTANDYSDHVSEENENDLWRRNHYLSYGLNLNARYERPLSRYYQLSFHANGNAYVNRQWGVEKDDRRQTSGNDPADDEFHFARPNIGVDESVRLAYYPDTRTSISIEESVNYQRLFGYYDIRNDAYDDDMITTYSTNNNQRIITVSVHGDASYYFSPRLQAGLNIGLSWNGSHDWNRSETGDSRINYLSRSFNYSIGTNVTWILF